MAKYNPNEISFRIDAFTPATLPSTRLAEYILDLAALLGSREELRFKRLGKGSATIVQWADEEKLAEIKQRALAMSSGDFEADDGVGPYQRLNQRLREDEAVGTLRIGREKVLYFPGRKENVARVIGPIVQNDYLDGQLVRVGGLDETVPVYLREGKSVYPCTTNIETAKKLAPYLYETIRLFGSASWLRKSDGQWELKRFLVENFQRLEDVPLELAVEKLRLIEPEDWDDSRADQIRLREG